MDTILKAENVTKKYLNKTALDSINLSVEKGKVMGLLGPNGSGKTTFLKIAAGLLTKNSGTVEINGVPVGRETKAFVSYLPDKQFLYKWMKIKDAFDYYQDFFKDFNRDKAMKLLEFMNLNEDMKVSALSKGMTEKLLLSLCLSRNSKLYLLDEPLGGVDPVTREKILDAILDNYSEDSSIIITTHLVSDIERLFDSVSFIQDGKIVLEGNAEELRNERSMSIDEIYREVFKNA